MDDLEGLKMKITDSYVDRMAAPGSYTSTPQELTRRLIQSGVPAVCVWDAFNDAVSFNQEAQATAGGQTNV
ncbi:hypothetical protein BH10PAT3_BH10PAT3_1430 [soil metagenome]